MTHMQAFKQHTYAKIFSRRGAAIMEYKTYQNRGRVNRKRKVKNYNLKQITSYARRLYIKNKKQ